MVTSDKNPLSYDVQNIEPVAPANVVRKYGIKEENSSQNPTKDSAYGSMDTKVHTNVKTSTPYKTEYKQNLTVENSINNSPSRSLSGSSISQNKSPLLNNAQRIQKTEEVFLKEMESLKGSSSTLQSVSSSSKERSSNPVLTTHNGVHNIKHNKNKTYISMKDTAYDIANSRSETNLTKDNYGQKVLEYPYTSMMNIVQGQIKISPHGNETNQNVVNVSVTQLKENRNQ